MNVKSRYLATIQNRRIIYSFLSRVYEKEVTIDLLEELRDKTNSNTNPLLAIKSMTELKKDKDLQTALEELGMYLRSIKEDQIEETRLELAVEYAKLFLGVGGKVPHPSESVYTCEDRYIMQYPSDEVLQIYWNAGVNKVKEYPEPADHIAVELQFMAYLCRKVAEALGREEKKGVLANLKMQKEFVNNHLVTWIPKLTQDILASSTIAFYRSIARITNRFIQVDTRLLETLLTELV